MAPLAVGTALSGAATATITAEPSVLKGSPNHSASVSSSLTGVLHYQWTISNGAITSGRDDSGSITYTVGQGLPQATLQCKVVDGLGNSAIANLLINVVDLPNTTITTPAYVTTGKNGYVASVPAQSGSTFVWSVPGGTILSGQGTNSITYSMGTSQYLSCTVTNSLGAQATSALTLVNAVPDPATAIIHPNTSYAGNFSGAKVWVDSSVVNSNTYKWTVLTPSLAALSKGDDMSTVFFDTYAYQGVDAPMNFQCVVTNAAGDSATIQGSSLMTSGAGSVSMTSDPATPGDSKVRVSITQEYGFSTLTSNPPPSPQWQVTPPYTSDTATMTPSTSYVDVPLTVQGAGLYGSLVNPTQDIMIHLCDGSGNCGPWNTTWSANMTLYAPLDTTITAPTSAVQGQQNLQARIPDQPGSIHWTISNGTITQNQGAINPTFSVGTSGTATLTCDAINIAGHHSIGSFQVHVYPIPNACISVPTLSVSNIATGCTASVPSLDGAVYNWTISGGSITSGQGSPNVTYSVAGPVGGVIQLTCAVSQPAVSGAPVATGVQSVSITGDLIINEIGSSTNDTDSRWIEVRNLSSSPVNLSNYQLRTPSITKPGASVTKSVTQTFPLPSIVIPSGGYAVIRGLAYDYINFSGPALACIDDTSHTQMPYWLADGFVELTLAGRTADFIRFGNSTVAPSETTAWSGTTNAPALPTSYGQSIARDVNSTDTNTSSDWKSRVFSTFGGPNDVASDVSSDGDGIPDSAKNPGQTFSGLPLYDWGARKGQKDVFIHVDYMDASQSSVPGDPALTPTKAALDKVVKIFAGHGIVIHFDVGDLFSKTAGDVANYNLDGLSHKVAYSLITGIQSGPQYSPVPAGGVSAYKYKALNMPIAQKSIFHYLLIGDTQDGNLLGTGFSGIAETPGNDFVVTLGHHQLTSASNRLINWQASTLMHEFGHNLGLLHGGNDKFSFKPNYYSIMNYLYQLSGLSVISNPGDRYYAWRANYKNPLQSIFAASYPSTRTVVTINGNQYLVENFGSLLQGPDSLDFMMDFSDGSGNMFMGKVNAKFDESLVAEANGVMRNGTGSIDFNGDKKIKSTTYSLDVNNSGNIESYGDFDDWTNLLMAFNEYVTGANNGTDYISTLSNIEQSAKKDKASIKRKDVHGDGIHDVAIETLTIPVELIN